ncbi:GDSL esterase/lipase, partial [Thalictrum thalictroides]
TKVGLPMLNPYLDKNASFNTGVNFAVAGSTALTTEHLLEKGIISPVTNSSLLVQFDWFKDHLRYVCSTDAECANKLKNAIFMVGETGGNDINYALLQHKSIAETQSLVHDIVNNIITVAKRLIDLGAKKLVVPGNFPIGCFPIYLNAFESDPSMSFDNNSCIKELNEFARYQNQYLQRALDRLKEEEETNNVVILYADYYKAFESIFDKASDFGFDEVTKTSACCGAGGNYHFNLQTMCGTGEVSACSNPNQLISWDGIHPTQAAYQRMAEWLIRNLKVFSCIA